MSETNIECTMRERIERAMQAEIDRLRAQVVELTDKREQERIFNDWKDDETNTLISKLRSENKTLNDQLSLAYNNVVDLETQVAELTKERDALKSKIQWYADYANDANRSVTEWIGKANTAQQETAREIIQYIIDQGAISDKLDGEVYEIRACDITELRTKYGFKEVL